MALLIKKKKKPVAKAAFRVQEEKPILQTCLGCGATEAGQFAEVRFPGCKHVQAIHLHCLQAAACLGCNPNDKNKKKYPLDHGDGLNSGVEWLEAEDVY